MKTEQTHPISPEERAALAELKGLLRTHYPAATFSVRRGIDDPESIQLWTTVDVEDTDTVLDVVIDRVMAFQIEQAIPVHVIPVRPRTRIRAMRQQEAKRLANRASL